MNIQQQNDKVSGKFFPHEQPGEKNGRETSLDRELIMINIYSAHFLCEYIQIKQKFQQRHQ